MVAQAASGREGRPRKSRLFPAGDLSWPATDFKGLVELVPGATGYVGGRLAERLREEGRAVRVLARDPARVPRGLAAEVARGDVITGAGVPEALRGCTVAYYLVHSMEAVAGDARAAFADRDRRAAERFAAAATAAGVERVVYLGGLAPAAGERSPHIASRLEVEEILLARAPGATALRASIVIGARSASFRLLVRLVERLRLLPLPAWRDNRTQPIAERDAIEYLALTPATPAAVGRSLDIAGPDVVSYGQMIRQIAEHMGVGRVPVGMGVSQTPAASAIVSAITGQPIELVRPLMESLEQSLLPRDGIAQALYGIKPLPFGRAVERALAEWETREALAAW